jgi:ADP-dependent NAD(P)H-hydrate dehydratase / NAD(P)H-hydrate epimerase
VKPILTPSEAAELDRASQERGTGAETLMENAGRAVAEAAVRLAGGRYGKRAVVVCGKGNNGGDGLVAARHLDAWGSRVTVLLLDSRDAFREPAATNLTRLERPSVRVRPWSIETLARELARVDVAIDAIFGTGFRGAPEGAYGSAIAALANADVPTVAVDIPSGVNGETGAVDGPAVDADITVTFGAAKPGVVLLPGAERAGVVEVADIGFPDDLVHGDVWLVEDTDVAAWLPARQAETHKRSAGYAVVIGGSRTMTGAVGLMARAAYGAGAGLVAAAVPGSILSVVQTMVREAVFAPLPETDAGTVANGSERLIEVLGQADAVALGPGMTTDERTSAWIREFVRSDDIPLVLDADGLNAFAGRAAELADRHAGLVLTPHVGEFARMAGVGAGDVASDRIGHVRKLAAETEAVVLLKGSRTLIASPDGSVRVNPTGGSFLATGGTGDVLTGMIAGLLARGIAPADAASAAAYVHGVAGAEAGEELGVGTTAGDVLDRVAHAFAEVADE